MELEAANDIRWLVDGVTSCDSDVIATNWPIDHPGQVFLGIGNGHSEIIWSTFPSTLSKNMMCR